MMQFKKIDSPGSAKNIKIIDGTWHRWLLLSHSFVADLVTKRSRIFAGKLYAPEKPNDLRRAKPWFPLANLVGPESCLLLDILDFEPDWLLQSSHGSQL